MNAGKEFFVNLLSNHSDLLNNAIKSSPIRNLKSLDASEKVRKEGNALFLKSVHSDALHAEVFELYCKSIAFAPSGSEALALAYGNRSAFLLHIKKYDKSIEDVNKALEITNSNALRVKMLCRKINSLIALDTHVDDSYLESAKNYFDKIDDSEENKERLLKLINETKELLNSSKQKVVKIRQNQKKSLETVSNEKKAADVFDSVSIKHDEKYGRHLVAARHFQPGEIIFVEKLYAGVLEFTKHYTNCNFCLKTSWSGMPCDHCDWAMYCSESCKAEAWEKHHHIECLLIPFGQFQDFLEFYHVCVRMLIIGIKEAGSIAELRKTLGTMDAIKGIFFWLFYVLFN